VKEGKPSNRNPGALLPSPRRVSTVALGVVWTGVVWGGSPGGGLGLLTALGGGGVRFQGRRQRRDVQDGCWPLDRPATSLSAATTTSEKPPNMTSEIVVPRQAAHRLGVSET
jgi:hypothetical protein